MSLSLYVWLTWHSRPKLNRILHGVHLLTSPLFLLLGRVRNPGAATQVTRAPLSPDLGPSQPSEALNSSPATSPPLCPLCLLAPGRSRSPPVPSASCRARTRGEAEARLRPEPSHGLGRLTQLRGLFVRPGGGLRTGKTNRAKAQQLEGWLGLEGSVQCG